MPSKINRKKNPHRKRKPKISFNTRVLQAIQITAEHKIAKHKDNANIMSNFITDNNVYQLMPRIAQGSGANGQRNGNEITLKKLTIKGYITIPPQTTAVGGEFLGRVMILRSREFSANQVVSDPANNFDYSNLMEYNQPYIGDPNNWLQGVNKNSFISRRDKRLKLFIGTNQQGDDSNPPYPDSIRYFSMTLTFGKQGKKLHYNSSTDMQTENFPYFMCAVIHTPTGEAVGGLTGATLNYYTEAHYTDL